MSDLNHDIPFDRTLAAPAGEMRGLSLRIRRMIAPNPGPFTFTGTCTYVVGHGEVAVIDPGPDDAAHVAALRAALAGETITHILVTHTHRDHSPGARLLKALTGAPIIGCARHEVIENAPSGRLDASHDLEHVPDRVLQDGESLIGRDFELIAVATPGHASNHLCFGLPQEKALFSGDHVMAWSTTIVAPPDGVMSDYMASLEKLRARQDAIFWPGHGGPVKEPQRFLRALAHHRRSREASILAALQNGASTIPAIVGRSYDGLDPRLVNAACLSVLAHLEDLVTNGRVMAEGGAATLAATYSLAP